MQSWPGRGLGVEGYPQPDLGLVAGDVDVFDQQSQQLLPLGTVELVYHFADLPGEVGDAAPDLMPGPGNRDWNGQQDPRQSSGCLAMTSGSRPASGQPPAAAASRSEEHTSELQSPMYL